MQSAIVRIFTKILDKERRCLRGFVHRFGASRKPLRILDVGCGYGRNLEWMVADGFDAIGVDSNAAAIARNRERGFRAVELQEFTKEAHELFDIVLMSHFIEHFQPSELLQILDEYLKLLRPGGHLIVATPLPSAYFYEDFTHIKPYHPESLLMVFGESESQVSMRARCKLSLMEIWFRRSPWKVRSTRACYRDRSFLGLRMWLDSFYATCFLLSGGYLGAKDGWVGVFEKRR